MVQGQLWEFCYLNHVLVAQSCPIIVTPLTSAHPAPLSMEFSRQEYWSGLPFPLQGIFLIQGSNLCLLYCRQIFTIWATKKPYLILTTPLYIRRFYYHPQLYMRKQRYMRCHKMKTRSHTSQNTGLWFEPTLFKGECRRFTTSFFISSSYQNIVLTWLM